MEKPKITSEANIDMNDDTVIETDDNVIEIAGEPKYYSTGQVANMLNENESTIRFWCNEFEQFLKIERSGRNRQFTATDIKKLKYIQYLLREENFTIKQVKEFLSSKEAELMKPISKEREKLIIQALSQIIIPEIVRNFQVLEQRITANVVDELKVYLSDLYTPIQNGIKDISQELKQQNQELKEKMDALEKQIAERDARFIAFVEEFRNRKQPPKSLYQKIKAFFQKD